MFVVAMTFTSVEAQTNGTGLSGRTLENVVSFYPNPVSETLHIQVQAEGWENSLTIELIDPIGRQIEEIILDRVEISNIAWEVSQRPEGLYFLRVIKDEGAVEIHRVTISH